MLYVVTSEPPTKLQTTYCGIVIFLSSNFASIRCKRFQPNWRCSLGGGLQKFFLTLRAFVWSKIKGPVPPPLPPPDPPLALGHFCRMTGVIVSSKSHTVLQSRPRPTGLPKYPTKRHKKGIIIFNSPLMLPDTSITNAMEFSDFKFRNFAKMSSPTVERMSLRNMLVASIARSAAILCKLKKTNRRKKKRGNTFN